MDTISINDIEVKFRIGVSDEERSKPQRLSISVEMDLDIRASSAADDLEKTVDYFEVHQSITKMGAGCDWKLIETLAEDIAKLVLREALVLAVRVEVKKFILPQTRHVSVRIERFTPFHVANSDGGR